MLKDGAFVADLAMPFPKPRDPEIRYRKEFLDIRYEILLRMEGR